MVTIECAGRKERRAVEKTRPNDVHKFSSAQVFLISLLIEMINPPSEKILTLSKVLENRRKSIKVVWKRSARFSRIGSTQNITARRFFNVSILLLLLTLSIAPSYSNCCLSIANTYTNWVDISWRCASGKIYFQTKHSLSLYAYALI